LTSLDFPCAPVSQVFFSFFIRSTEKKSFFGASFRFILFQKKTGGNFQDETAYTRPGYSTLLALVFVLVFCFYLLLLAEVQILTQTATVTCLLVQMYKYWHFLALVVQITYIVASGRIH